jgi:23S rRNA pseudouridine1911/1915/1917 synthase
VTLTINETNSGRRLDGLLASLFPGFSRSCLAKAIKAGKVSLDGRCAKPSTVAKLGQVLSFLPPEPENPTLNPFPEIVLEVIYQDNELLVINKPAGLTVHPGAGCHGPTLASALLALDPDLAQIGPSNRPGLVHRLDKDTSGVLVVARTQQALEFLSRCFKSRQVDKRYLAIVTGTPPDFGRIESPIGRNPAQRHKMTSGKSKSSSCPNTHFKEAATLFRTLKRFPATGLSLVSLKLLTGRTHQARVHLASIGSPVLADPLYGAPLKALTKAYPTLTPLLKRQFLHARRLQLPHPNGGRATFRAPWPQDFLDLWQELLKIEF